MMSIIITIFLLSQAFSTTDLYVGYPDKGKDFSNIQDAVNEAASINPQNESERVTIHISPGIYRQQIRIETSYITFKNEEPKKGTVLITWYYGIGYKYYSANEFGYYDKTLAEEKKSKNPAKFRWGATVLLLPTASYFRAENIYFENSFNNYLTEEELKDGVELTYETGITVERNTSLDVCARTSTERAAAFSAEGPFAEFYNCEFHSNQDTLFTSNSPQYFKNCVIEGMTDYIFGESNAVFESCELRWKGYSDKDKTYGGVITAARKKEDEDESVFYSGYFFYNCRITASKKFESSPGNFGRPWRKTAKVTFVNTIVENENIISDAGWGSMACEPEDAELFLEYGTRFTNGSLVDTSKRRGKLMANFDYAKFDLKYYMNNWIPYYSNSKNMEDYYEWGSMKIGGGGFISGLVVGKREMYLRTDVGGAYKYDYKTKQWVQLFSSINEGNKGYMSVKGIAIDPNDDDIVYFLCGCAYHYPYRTAILKTINGGLSFFETDITDLIEVHGNGAGRECGEPIAIDPENSNIIYAGGDVTSWESALIKSTDGGLSWEPVKGYNDLGFFKYELRWPTWTDHTVRGTNNGEYNTQSGINSIKIINKKVYVGTSIVGQPNIHVAEIEKDEFEPLSLDLPYENYPLSIKYDGLENIYFTYIKDVRFDGKEGGAYRYNLLTKEVKNISPTEKALVLAIDKNDKGKIIARTVACWLQQFWSEKSIVYGDHFYRSTDGGETWTNITPGQIYNKGKEDEYYISLPLKENGYSWIVDKSIHWGSGLDFDPRNPYKLLMTSGNGLFVCDNIWDEKNIQFYFDPNGIEETVPMDMISVKNGFSYSAIRDFDGFIHKNINEFGIQYQPNMGNTAVIAYCKKNPKIMLRMHITEDLGYFSEDMGVTWKKMGSIGGVGSGRGAITEVGDEKYRFFHATKDGIIFSDDHGISWNNSKGLIGEEFGIFVEESDPMIVYSYSYLKKTETNPKGKNILGISGDGGKTFMNKIISDNDGNEFSNRIAYLGKGKIALSAGNNGIYIVSQYGEKITKVENVEYCKTIGFGAPENKNDDNTLYMYGRPLKNDPDGLYRSQDGGFSWVLVNHEQLYGGTGDGNFVVGDMNNFGLFYMSSLGYGIVYGKLK